MRRTLEKRKNQEDSSPSGGYHLNEVTIRARCWTNVDARKSIPFIDTTFDLLDISLTCWKKAVVHVAGFVIFVREHSTITMQGDLVLKLAITIGFLVAVNPNACKDLLKIPNTGFKNFMSVKICYSNLKQENTSEPKDWETKLTEGTMEGVRHHGICPSTLQVP